LDAVEVELQPIRSDVPAHSTKQFVPSSELGNEFSVLPKKKDSVCQRVKTPNRAFKSILLATKLPNLKSFGLENMKRSVSPADVSHEGVREFGADGRNST
jgi:hypothetical protein